MSGRRECLGSWTCPSGNRVEAFYQPIKTGLGELKLEWDTPPPLTAPDDAYYVSVILPAVVARAREFTEAIGPAVILSVETPP